MKLPESVAEIISGQPKRDPSPSSRQTKSGGPERSSVMTDGDIVKLFARMQHLFAHRWVSAYGPAMDGDKLSPSARQWKYDLREYSRDQVQFGLARMIEHRPDWPPGPIEFMNLCDGIPSVAQVLDRDHDYGPICRAIRSRMDWFNLDALSASKRRAIGAQQYETALVGLRREGSIRSLSAQLIAEHKKAEALPTA